MKKYTHQIGLVILGLCIFLTGSMWLGASPNSQYAALNDKMDEQFQQVKHLIGANTSLQIIYLKVMYLKPDISTDTAKKIAAATFKHSRAMKKNPDLVLSIINVESSFLPRPSPAGAEGLMQVMPSWKKTVCNGYDLNDIDQNIKCGTAVYSLYEEQYKDMRTALTVYNRGPSAVDLAVSKNQNPHNGYADKVLSVYSKLQAIGEMESEEL